MLNEMRINQKRFSLTDSIPYEFAETGCYFGRLSYNVTRFQVIGERSSGTNFLNHTLLMNTALEPSEVLGWKHGTPQMEAIPTDLVVLISVRRADTWASSMFAKPWHATQRVKQLGFSDFLRSEWETIVDRARYFPQSASEQKLGLPLQLDRDPLTGALYPNLFALRNGKLRTHLSYLNRACHVCLVRHETVVANPERFVHAFLQAFGLPPMTLAFRPVKKKLGARYFSPSEAERIPPDELSAEDMALLLDQCNLNLEARLGYRY